MKKRPELRVYVVSNQDVGVPQTIRHLTAKFKANRITHLEGEGIKSIIFNIPMRKLNDAWTYLRKKRGIRKVWLGK